MSEQTTTIPEELTQQQAIGLLIQGVEMAQSRGAYNLNEAANIAKEGIILHGKVYCRSFLENIFVVCTMKNLF